MTDDQFKHLQIGDKVSRSGTLEILTILTIDGGYPTAGVIKCVDSPAEWSLLTPKEKKP